MIDLAIRVTTTVFFALTAIAFVGVIIYVVGGGNLKALLPTQTPLTKKIIVVIIALSLSFCAYLVILSEINAPFTALMIVVMFAGYYISQKFQRIDKG